MSAGFRQRLCSILVAVESRDKAGEQHEQHICMWVSAHECRRSWRPEEGVGSPGAAVTDSCVRSSVSAWN